MPYKTEIDGVIYKFKSLSIEDIIQIGMEGSHTEIALVDKLIEVAVIHKDKKSIPYAHKHMLAKRIQDITLKMMEEQEKKNSILRQDKEKDDNKKMGYIV
jgi:hypothetical protein